MSGMCTLARSATAHPAMQTTDMQVTTQVRVGVSGTAHPTMQTTDMQGTTQVRVGINGFGRIGRQACRILMQRHPTYVIKHINSTQNAQYMKYLLEHDTVHGRFDGSVEAAEDAIVVNGHRITLSCTRDATLIPWDKAGVEYVIECTGAHLTTQACQAHLQNGAKKVIISAPAKDDTPIIVVGVNDASYDKNVQVVSCASCTTNGLAPLVKVIHEAFGVAQGLMTTVHAATASQVTVDGTSSKDWRAGRAASQNIIPSSTGAAKAVGKCYPPIAGKLTGIAVRVPVVDVSMVDLTCTLETPTTYENICKEIERASTTYAKGIVGYTDAPVVSSDFIGETCSTVFDASAGLMLSPTFVKLVAWYDNEWGYSTRLCDLVGVMASADGVLDPTRTAPAHRSTATTKRHHTGSQSADSVTTKFEHELALQEALEDSGGNHGAWYGYGLLEP